MESKLPEQAIKEMLKAGWTKVIVLGVWSDDKMSLVHNDLKPIEIVGLIECLKMMTVRTWSDAEARKET